MDESWKSFLEALGAGGAGGSIILAIVLWIIRDKFFNWVEASFDIRAGNIKKKIDGIYEEDILRREQWIEETRRNAHSITGLTDIMTEHDEKLELLQGVPFLLQQQTHLLSEIKIQAEQNRKETVDQGKLLAALIERRNFPREA